MEANKPRKQQLCITTKPLIEPAFAVIRVSWYSCGKEDSVDEVQLEDGIDNVEAVLETLIRNALQAGADVSVMTTAKPEQFGVAV